MQYRLIYEYAPSLWPVGFGLIGVVVGALLMGVPVLKRLARFARFGFMFFALFTLVAVAVIGRQYAEISRARRRGLTRILEGRVHNLSAGADHKEEVFLVDTVRFAYSDYIDRGGFHKTQARAGPIREGLEVRIEYLPTRYENAIVRLEIKQ